MNKAIISISPPLSGTELNVTLFDPIGRAHCLDVESFMQMSVVIVMKSYSCT